MLFFKDITCNMKYYVEFIPINKIRVPWLVVDIHPESPTKSVLGRRVAAKRVAVPFLRWNGRAGFMGLRFMWSLGVLLSEGLCVWLKALLEILNNFERGVLQFHLALDP